MDPMTQAEMRHLQDGRLRVTQTGWLGMQKHQPLHQDDHRPWVYEVVLLKVVDGDVNPTPLV
jgi:hypothetical protein